MSDKLLIFGNGLGMALDPKHFSLSNALKQIWDDKATLDDTSRKLIARCLNTSENPPRDEAELDNLHLAVLACEFLNNLESGKNCWLNDYGRRFPTVVAKYIYQVATFLCNYDGSLPSSFSDSLCDFLKETNSHVATLNYDKLLYSSLLEREIFSGYDGYLVDGMLDSGFYDQNLERLPGRSFGYYLHLHGSPLFIDRDGIIKKLSLSELTLESQEIGRHIVLTHIQHKPSVISASTVLSAYWNYLGFCLNEAKEILLFGYSGLDIHLNQLLKPYIQSRKIRIIEWTGSGTEVEREKFWKDRIGDEAELILMENILDFKDW